MTSDLATAVSLSGIRVAYDGREVLAGATAEMHSGDLTVIVGANGAGKSTLLEVIAGTTPVAAGTRAVDGALAFVPQRAAIPPRLPVTVHDVVAVGVWGRIGMWRRGGAELRMRVSAALDRLGIADLARRPFGELSGGQQQRALLAQGLARGADVLLLDEPTTGLDRDSSARILEVLRAEAAAGAAVVCVSHDPAVIDAADRVIRIADARAEVEHRGGGALP